MTTDERPAAITLADFSWRADPSSPPIIRGITLDVRVGEAVLVTGASGSGKTTLAHAIAGLLGDDGYSSGELVVHSQEGTGEEPIVGMVFQQPDDQTILHRVDDDVAFGLENIGFDPAKMGSRIRKSLDSVGLDLPFDHPTEALSGGQRQRLAMAGALAMNPSVLILDEPLQALDSKGKTQVVNAVTSLRARSPLTLIVVDHEPAHWLAIVDRVVTLERGMVKDVCRAREFSRPSRKSLVSAPPPARVSPGGNVVVEARDLVVGREGVPLPGAHSLSVSEGDVVALVGSNGSGKTTLALTMAGILPPISGEVIARHCDHRLSSLERSKMVALVPQNPSHHHLGKTVGEDLLLSPLARGLTDIAAKALAYQWATRFGIDHLWDRNPQGLSGGEKRRVAIAAALTQEPRLLILDEPTQSVDDESWVECVDLVNELARAGTAVIVVSHDTEFVEAIGAREYQVGSEPAPFQSPVVDKRASWLAKANPLGLFLASGIVAFGLITTLDVVSATVSGVASAVMIGVTGLGLRRVIRRLIPIFLAAVFSGVTIALYGRESGEVFFSWGLISVSEGSLELALATLLRIIAIATPAVVLFTGINATSLADNLSLRWRLPERFVIGALAGIRLVQLLGGDYATLQYTRDSRGVGGRPWWRRVFSDVFTLLVIALRRADTLALAMEARGFSAPGPRTHFRSPLWRGRDTVIVGVGLAVAVASVGAAVVSGEFNAIIG